ncbi:MAG: Ig-like domain-containing protein, partial [Defluviitaleaceae bacterium]|nr:Ig-like domain-containing protein [Defluviitaleaceae bacterium]
MKIKQLLKRVTAIVLVGMLLVGIVPITALAYVFTFEESPRVEHIEITAFSPNYFIDISSEQFPISSEHIAITAFVPRHNEVFAESYATIIDLEVSLVASSENSTLLRYEILHNGRLVSGNQLSESMEILAFADNLFDDVPMLEAHEGISGERDDEIEAERLRELANAPMSENVALLGDIAIDSLPVSVHRMSHNIMYGIELVQSAHAGNYNVIIHYEVDGVSRTHSTGVFYLDVVEKDLQISIDGFNDDLFGMDFTDFSGIQPFSAANPEVRVYNASGVHQVNINTLRAALTSTLAGRRIYILRDLNNLGNWVPVNPTANFTLDGQGHILTLTVAVSGAGSNAGLFGSASNRIITIQNVGIQVEDISARHEVDTGTANTRAGGFFGLVNGGTITIRQSFVAGGYVWARTGRNNDNRLHRNTWSHAGGFIGDVQGGANVTIEDSFVGARVYARSHSGSSGNTAQAMAGGFIGHVWNSTLTIRRSYASGTVFSYARNPHIFGTSESYGGGIVGRRTGGSAPTVTHVAFANDLNIRGISIGGGTLTLGTRLNLTQLRNSSTAPLNNWSWGSVWEFRGDSDATNVDFSMWGHPVLRVFYNVRRVDFSTFTNPLPGDFRDITATIPQGRQRLRYRARSGDARQMPTITWQSSNAWVASVPPTPNPTPRFSNQGATSIRVSAVNSGSAVITPTVRGVPLIGFNFNVNQPPSTDIRFNRVNHGVIQDGSTIRLARGTTSTTGNITATVDPSNANQNVTWNVNNTFFGSPGSSVTMSGTGNTRNFTAGNALGTARITATSVGTPAINRSFNISVHHVYPTSVTFNTAAVNTQRGIGQTFTLSPQTTLPATRTTDNLTWTISTAHRNILDFATSGSGNTRTGANVSLIGRDAGTARVTASIFNTLTQQNITLGYVDITVSPVTVTINHAGTIVPIPMQVGGATRALTASVSPAGAPQNVQWSVSQGNAVTVNASGVVSPARAGDATVTASLGTALSVPPASVARPSDSVVFEVLPLFSGGTGTVADPWRISTFADLNNIRDYVRAFPDRTRHHFILTHDIGTTANPIPVGHNWQPIGGNGHPDFVGVFDGNGHRIIGLNIDRANYDYVGLFGRVGSGGVIRNVGLLNARVTGRRYVGGIAGFTAGDILNSFNEAGDVYGAVAAV